MIQVILMRLSRWESGGLISLVAMRLQKESRKLSKMDLFKEVIYSSKQVSILYLIEVPRE